MTIRLLSNYDNCPPNSIITLDAGTETGLVNGKQASFDLTGGVAFVPQAGPLQTITVPVTVAARRAIKVALAEGCAVSVAGSLGAVGTVSRLDENDVAIQSWPIAFGTLAPVGPYAGVQKILISCTAGSIVVAVANAVLGTARAVPDARAISSLGSSANLIAGGVTNYSRIKAKLDAVRAGIANARIMVVGSSEQASYRSKSPTNSDGSRPDCAAQTIAMAINSTAMPATAAAVCGDSNIGSGASTGSGTFFAYDTRVTKTGTSQISTLKTIGGNAFRTLAAADSVSFQFQEPVDTFRVWMLKDTGTGTFNLSRTGDTTSPTYSTVNAGGQAFGSYTFTGALGLDALTITQVNGNTLFICAVEAWNSAQPSVLVMSAAWIGGSSADRSSTATPTSYLSALIAMAPDLVFLCEDGINDGRLNGSAVTPAQHLVNLEKQITLLLPVCDIILETGFPYQITQGSYALQKQYRDNIVAMGAKYGLIVNDAFMKDVSWELQNSLGKQSDSLHKTTAGYLPHGQAKAGILLAL